MRGQRIVPYAWPDASDLLDIPREAGHGDVDGLIIVRVGEDGNGGEALAVGDQEVAGRGEEGGLGGLGRRGGGEGEALAAEGERRGSAPQGEDDAQLQLQHLEETV